MGGCVSEPVSKEEKERQKQIEVQLRRDKRKFQAEVKLLLLGAGESGKSTFAKQMKIIYDTGFSEEEKKQFRDVIHSNLIMNMRSLVMATQKMGLTISADNAKRSENLTSPSILTHQEVTGQVAEDIKALWADPVIQEAYERASEFQLGDSAAYFFDSLDRLTGEFVPTEQDVLRSRAKTTGITETEFDVDGAHFRMVDVGGQRSERKKWIHCFQEVTAVIFFVALSEYDLKLYEDETVNRMHESIKLFDEICNSRWFSNTSVILFLNKKDLFKSKIKVTDLSICFPDYQGGKDYDKATEYITNKFTSLNRNAQKEKQVYPHLTCATDTNNIRYIFSATKDIILQKALSESGF
eukprot:TRINITY_DN64_c0_g2_i1.p1 TRINITY_DN64_c0_g2~~TRINITY_DN64_c0_g2_i1.p1  ORF type:complete len:353 (+),score=104.48 TRINITY_DN64_c0_g2_i1:141-1199(+)